MKEKIIVSAIVLLCLLCMAGCKSEEPEPVHIKVEPPEKKHIVIYNGDEKVFDCIGDIRYKHNEDGLTDVIIQMAGDAQ